MDFPQKRRQRFLSKAHYMAISAFYDQQEAYWLTNDMESDSPEQEAALKSRHIQAGSLSRIILTYTAGETIEEISPRLEHLIQKYEEYQKKSALYEATPNISPLAIDDWAYQYEECVQVISLCILLHRIDLLKRFVALIDNAGYAGEDTLYEDLLAKVLPDRHDVDEWYHDVYTPLIRATYVENKADAARLLKEYCNQWYPAFAQAPWHDSHLDGEEGSYVGYWAFEAGAIAFLYGIDDSQIDHMVYPKDLVAYARNFIPPAGSTQIGRVEAGQPCPRAGYWFTPAQANSRRHFQQGELMPCFTGSSWGDTLWYWSGEESA
ncbi:PoNe immunity protein domain-containing protein [Pseudomonas oryzae]|uniref:PoNi C-terminal domain-containing protein n=1 Tax=Pseudomonas oryzae TaxID=1392877 RepID=A0A1H1N6A1_9PSED|nr:PoNe immunity protein domain-containing protein [Pseudomonas oryzae]SDR94255.1 protein of unknown function [Pseudomonas oryzae]